VRKMFASSAIKKAIFQSFTYTGNAFLKVYSKPLRFSRYLIEEENSHFYSQWNIQAEKDSVRDAYT